MVCEAAALADDPDPDVDPDDEPLPLPELLPPVPDVLGFFLGGGFGAIGRKNNITKTKIVSQYSV